MHSSSRFSLRPVSAEDEVLLRTLFAAARREDLLAAGLGEREAEQLLEMQYRAQRHQYLAAFPGADSAVIEVEGEALGRLLIDRRGQQIRLVDIALLPAARGQGIGEGVLEALKQEAEEIGGCIRLQVARGNPARRLYERLGFSETSGDEMYVEMQWDAQARGPASSDNRKTMGAAP
jgi:ribosomal protein S18 acetylase RimI-like enzyme